MFESFKTLKFPKLNYKNDFFRESEKLISFLSQPISSAISLNKGQLQKIEKEIGPILFNLIVESIPEKYESRTLCTTFQGLVPGEIVTLVGVIGSWKAPTHSKAPWNMMLNFDNKKINVSFFGKVGLLYSKQFPEKSHVIISGEISHKSFVPSFVNPEIFKYDNVWKELLSGFVPVYKKIQGVSHLFMLRTMREATLKLMQFKGDWLFPEIYGRYNYPPLINSLLNIHFPTLSLSEKELEEKSTPYHERLAFDKLFFFQYGAWALRKEKPVFKPRKVKICSKESLIVEKNLPFPLTNAQKRVLSEIRRDLAGKIPMSRLLQGDVGSGKTVVILLAAIDVFASGYSTVIMAPTEILAKQHFESFKKFTSNLDIKIEFLAGGLTGKKKEEAILKAETADIIIGTHALFENLNSIKRLGFVVIDEQHRFGVNQRIELMNKAFLPDTLVVSATPIPRSLALTMYGGVDISVINEMPPGRTPVKTRFVTYENRSKVVDYICEIVEQKEKKGYWVCPLIEESEKMQLNNVLNVFNEFKEKLGDKVVLLHGKMKGEEKNEILNKLRTGEAKIIISTVVIEVGVDVTDASFIVIENAEQFGMAQLHQLRGRVGRGKIKSFCALISGEKISENAYKRLKFMETTDSGFKIAEYDLKKRGPGALSGFEQSGFKNDPYFMLAAQYGIIVQKARSAVESFFESSEVSAHEKEFIKSIFNRFFKEKIKRYKIG